MKIDAVQRLARRVAERSGAKVSNRPRHLKSVEPGSELPGLSAIQRDVLYSRIRDLGNLYWLNWLIRQETAHVMGVMECLCDEELLALREKMLAGKECREEGIAFTERGLIREIDASVWATA